MLASGIGVAGKSEFVLHGIFQAAVEDQALLPAVGNHFNFPHHDIGAVGCRSCAQQSVSLNLPMRFASSVNCDAANAAGIDRDRFIRDIVDQREPIVRLELEADVAARAGIVVYGHWNRDPVALRERDWQVEIDEEILKDFQARSGAAQRAVRVEASIAIRQVVMESAIGMVMLARPSLSVMISGLM